MAIFHGPDNRRARPANYLISLVYSALDGKRVGDWAGLERFKVNYKGTLCTHHLSREALGKFGGRKDMYPSGAACMRLLESVSAYRTVVGHP